MKYLLDTDVIINFIRGKTQVEEELKNSEGFVSIITVGELVYGAHKSTSPNASLQKLKSFLQDLSIQVINVDREIVYKFGELKADFEIKGQRLEDFDQLIAATCIVNNLILVTRNTKHFSRIKNLEIYSPEK